MRYLVVTRGPQGAGKSTFLREQGLEAYCISPDALRLLYGAPVLTSSGELGIAQDQNARVWKMVFRLLEERMERGELLVVDATHPSSGHFATYQRLCARFGYALACMDFSTMPLERVLRQNAARDPIRRVGEAVIRKTHADCLDGGVPDGVHHIVWREDGAHGAELTAWLDQPVLDLSAYRRVHHIGDLQGCLTPLLAYLDGPLAPDEAYLFVGDLCDRGDENAEVVRWFLDHGLADNVLVHWGNHEEHLARWSRGLPAVSREFAAHTEPQLRAGGLVPEDLVPLIARLRECTAYTYGTERVFVCHAGLSTVPATLAGVSSRQYRKGTGFFSDPVGDQFSRHAPAGWTQVHGHRNHGHRPIRSASRCFNLEDGVEYGGNLRAVVLDAEGWHPVAVRNRTFRNFRHRLGDRIIPFKSELPSWLSAESPDVPTLSSEGLQELRAHPLVYEKQSAFAPHVSAFHFTRDAFFDRKWDALNVRARGLFVATQTRTIVARSYDKFFNVGERPETQHDALAESLVFPVTAYLKDNGYLGILGYDRTTDALFWSSKTTPDSEFAGWFREIGERTLGPSGCERVRRYLRDTHSSMVFEVIDPVRDPHIIAYEEAHLVLLDVVHRAERFETLAYDKLVRLGQSLGLRVKERAMSFSSWPALAGWMKAANHPDWTYRGRPVEGFVLVDDAGFHVKLKLDFYAFWKRMRSLKDRVRKTRGTQTPLARDVSDPRVRAFYDWLVLQPDAVLGEDIAAVRHAYLSGEMPEVQYVPPRETPVPSSLGRMLDSLVAKPEGYAIKPATADRVLAACLEDDEKMELLAACSARIRIVVAATPGPERDEVAERLVVDID